MYQDPTVYPLKSCVIKEMPKTERKRIFNLYTTGILWRTAQWTISAPQTYYSMGWKQVFTCLESAKVKKLVLDLNERPTILRHINHIHFPDLKQLWLHGNNIQSIELLSWMDFKNLQILSLSANKLSKVDSLVKCKLNFKLLDLEENSNLKIGKLEKMNLQNLIELSFDYHRKNPTICEDSSCVVKTKFQKKGSIRLNSSKRIKQTIVYDSICRKEDQIRVTIARI